MSKNIYRLTHPDGTTLTATGERICTELGVTYSALSIAEKKGFKLKGCIVEAVFKKPTRRYRLTGHGLVKTGLTAKQAATILGIKSNAVSVYAKTGYAVGGYVVHTDNEMASERIIFVKSSGMFRCPECVYRDDDEECSSHQCTRPKGFYALESSLSVSN